MMGMGGEGDKPKKPALGLLIGVGKPKESETEMDEETPDDPRGMAAQGLLEAFESGDAEAVASAFETMMDACGYTKSEPPAMEEGY